nr:AAA family ATPase [Texcoconibacillus texcoconensis]
MRRKGQINVVLKNSTPQPAVRDAPIGYPKAEGQDWLQSPEHAPYQRMQESLDALVGLEEIKGILKEIYAWLYLNEQRRQQGLLVKQQALHMVFKGNPGTGKTTVARIIARLFQDMKVLSKGHLIEAERADLVGEYIGHTAQKTRDLIKKAAGGILFIDEAYSLARGGEKDFGKEAIDTLVKGMEDRHADFVLILAGYPKEMDRFLSLNPGLPSRFPFHISFPNYSVVELVQIAEQMAADRQYAFDERLYPVIKNAFSQITEEEPPHFSNGRFIRNLLEHMIRAQAVRLLDERNYERDSLMTLKKQDAEIALKNVKFT